MATFNRILEMLQEEKEVFTAKKDPKNKNTFDVYVNGKYFTNIGAETEEAAIRLAKEEYEEQYKK